MQGLHYLETLNTKGINPELTSVQTLLEKCGLPQKDYLRIHVGGTNGKGSCTGYITAMLSSLGLSVGTLISPHIHTVNERILLNREEISNTDLNAMLLKVKEKSEHHNIPLTYYEALYVASLLYFDEKQIQVAVFEVGMGGRFDAVNALKPDILLITSVSLDHQKFLGNTVQEIAEEKFALIKQNCTTIANIKGFSLNARIREKCRKKGSEVFLYGNDIFSSEGKRKGEQFFHAPLLGISSYGVLTKQAYGEVQWENITLSLTALYTLLRIRGEEKRFITEKKTILQAIDEYLPPFRFQKYEADGEKGEIYLDVAHNEASFQNLLLNVRRELPPMKKKILLAAFSKEKDWTGFIGKACTVFDRIILTRYQYERSEEPETIREKLKHPEISQKKVDIFPSLNVSLREVLPLDYDECLIVTGSFHTVADFTRHYQQLKEKELL